MKNINRILLTVSAFALMALVTVIVVNCSDDEKKYHIGVSQCSGDAWREKLNSELLMMTYIADSVDVCIKSANDNSELQARQIDSLVAMDVDLLIVSPNDSEKVKPAIERAYDKGIPVVMFDRRISSEKYTSYIGCDNYRMGYDLGTYMADKLNGSGKIVEIRGLKGSSPALERHQGLLGALKVHPGVQLVDVEDAAWEEKSAVSAMERILSRCSDFDYVYAQNDRMAYGAYTVLKKRGLAGKVKIVGIDGLSSKNGGIEMVSKGMIDASYLNPTSGDLVMALALDILEHRPYERNNSLATSIITKNNAELTLMASNSASRQATVLESLHNQVNKYESYYETQSLLLWLLCVFLLFAIVGGGLVYKSYVEKNKLYMQLAKKNADLKKLNDEVLELTHSRLAFFTNVSHELRTPLTLIIDPVEKLFSDTALSHHTRELITIVHRNALALRRIVDDIMDFRKVQTGNMKLNLNSFDLKTKIMSWVDEFVPSAEKRGVNLIVNADGFTHDSVMADEGKINRIVFNLVSNALKYTKKDGSILVSLTDVGSDKLKISVSDTGVGISEIDQRKVFDRFFQAHNAVGGTGIGLAMVKAYAELHGGKATVNSQVGAGSVFSIVIPCSQDGSVADSHKKTDSQDGMNVPTTLSVDDGKVHGVTDKILKNDNLPTLLVVDDNRDIRTYIKGVLDGNYIVIEAGNGKEGVEMAKKFVPDVVVSDVMMPEMNGLELCSALKENDATSHIPIVLLTAKNLDDQKIEGYEHGADSYITKPFSSGVLKARIDNLLKSRKRLGGLYKGSMPEEVTDDKLESGDKAFIAKLRRVIQDNLSNADFGVEEISAAMGLSRVQLYRKVKALTGATIVDLLRKARLQRGRKMLETTDSSVAEVAYEVGFSSPSYFTKCFKDEYDMLPGDVRS